MLLMFEIQAHFKHMPLLTELEANRRALAINMALLTELPSLIDHKFLAAWPLGPLDVPNA